MAVVSPPYGTLLFAAPPATVGDLRYYPLPPVAADYDTIADAAFRTGRCHKFADITETRGVPFAMPLCSAAVSTDRMEIAIGEEFRWYFELKATKFTGVDNNIFTTGSVSAWLKTLSGGLYIYHKYEDLNGGSTTGADVLINTAVATAEYHEIEGRCKRTGTSTYDVEVLRDGVSQTSFTHTISGADKTCPMSAVDLRITVDSSKSATGDFRFGDFHMSWNNGITRRDQQFFTAWNPTIIGEDHPDADVTVSDYTGTPDTINRYANVNGVPYSDGSDSVVTGTAEKSLLLGWPAIGALGDAPVVAIDVQPYTVINTAPYQYVYQKNASTTSTALATVLAQSAGAIGSGPLLTDPDGLAWTQTLVDATDFGIRKPTTAGSGTTGTSEIWRYVLHGGNAAPQTMPLWNSEVVPVRRKERALQSSLSAPVMLVIAAAASTRRRFGWIS